MKKNLFAVIAIAGFMFFSCSDKKCSEGTWRWEYAPGVFCYGTGFTLFSDGTGEMVEPDCNNDCAGINPERKRVFYLNWNLTDDDIFGMRFTGEGEICGVQQTVGYPWGQDTIGGTLSCNGLASTFYFDSTVVYQDTITQIVLSKQ